MSNTHATRDLLGIVLRKGSDYDAFAALLDLHEFVYVIRFKRIFYVDGTLATFTLEDYADIESLEVATPLKMEPQGAVDVIDATVIGNDPTVNGFIENSETDPFSSWAPHRIVRRKNPFRQEGVAVTHRRTLPYRSQRTGEGVDVYVLDAGFDSDHVEWKTGEVEWCGGTNDASNVNVGDTTFTHRFSNIKHGQLVTSCAVGQHNGIARDSHLFFSGIEGDVTHSEEAWLGLFEVAYDHYMSRSATNRPAVLNCSYGTIRNDLTPSAAAAAGYEAMMDDGLIIVIPAANSKWDLDTDFVLPCESHPDIIVVGATSCFDTPMFLSTSLMFMSGYGSNVDIWAPGQKVICASPFSTPRQYGVGSGTSFAGPHTAGVIACMLQGYQRLTNIEQVRSVTQKLIDNSTKGELRFGDAYYGDGVAHDRLLYLDPHADFEEIDGLVPL